MSYNAQMTYDFGTDRLYLHATYHTKQLAMCSGMYMFMLGEGTPELVNLGKISVQTAPGRTTKQGDAYLGLLCSIPTAEQTPVGKVNGIAEQDVGVWPWLSPSSLPARSAVQRGEPGHHLELLR